MESSSCRLSVPACGILLCMILCPSLPLVAQDSSFGPSSSATTAAEPIRPSAASFVSVPTQKPHPQHRFWDNKNRALFGAVAGLSAGDFVITRSNLQAGGREYNPVTRVFGSGTPGLAVNFALETGSVIGASYLLHRTGHHKLERIAALLNIGGSAAAISYGVTHR